MARSPWSGALLPASLLRGDQGETLYREDDLAITDGAVAIPGRALSVGIWRLS